MRGSPLLRALLAFCLIAALGWPLWHLTHPPTVATAAAADAPTEAKAIQLQLEFTTLPRRFVVRHLEKDIWEENAPQASMERSLPLVYPDKGVDLVFHIEWGNEGALSAARLRLTDPAGERHEKSVWGHGTVDEVVTFP